MMDRKQSLYQSEWAKKKPIEDRPGEALTGIPDKPQLPNWAVQALRRGEDVPGQLLPMYLRWHHTCQACHRPVFLIHPYLMPALEEIVAPDSTSDLEALGVRSLVDPGNPIRTHQPCRWGDPDVPWDFEDPETHIAPNLYQYL